MSLYFKTLTFFFSFIILSSVFHSCNLDQVNKYYPNYLDAKSDNFFDKGWIPKDIVFESMSEIEVNTNLDINSCFFTFKLSELDLDRIIQIISRTEIDFKNPKRIKIRNIHVDAIKYLNKYVYINPVGQDTVFLSVDYKTNKVYGWRN